MPASGRTVGQVAALTGLSVRALHHYDAIGLATPSCRSAAGYRLYGDDDLRRLQQVLLFRELGFGLDAVRALVDAPVEQRREALLAQRDALERKRRHAETVLMAVDATLQSIRDDTPMNTEQLFDGYERFQHGEYAEEAERRWGDTDAWTTSRQRASGYSKDDWTRIQAEADAIATEFLAAMRRGDATDSERARALAECHREHIERHFYPCSHAMHANVAAMYISDARFQAHYERRGEGLAAYIEAAIRANSQAHARAHPQA